MKIGFLFPGQGSQRVGMGQDLYEKYEVVKTPPNPTVWFGDVSACFIPIIYIYTFINSASFLIPVSPFLAVYFWLPHTQTFPPAAVKQVTTLWIPSVAWRRK